MSDEYPYDRVNMRLTSEDKTLLDTLAAHLRARTSPRDTYIRRSQVVRLALKAGLRAIEAEEAERAQEAEQQSDATRAENKADRELPSSLGHNHAEDSLRVRAQGHADAEFLRALTD